ncbi:MAG TPA: PorV/PorQ family protein [Candidatus Edwardsbacteria bacterium]|nr:PorV/PorQ family protein [Candidatus Edwardsbacteria bacterium]
MRSFRLLLLLALALSAAPLAADGTTAASFLALDAGAGAIAMGGTVAARGGTVGDVFWNPGGLGWLRGTALTVGHTESVQSIRCEYLGAAYGTDRLTFAASLRSLSVNGLEERTGPSESPLSQFGVSGVAPAISCARSFGQHCAVGTSVRYVYQKIGADRAAALANDIGVSYRGGIAGLAAGAAITNWGSGVKFRDRSDPLPARLRAGASYAMFDNALLVAADVVQPFHQRPYASIGAEGVMRDMVSLRAGYRGGLGDAGGLAGLSAGLGVAFRGYQVDYAFSSQGALGMAHHLSLSFSATQAARAGERSERIIAAELQRRGRLTAETFYQQGLAQQQAGKLEEALASFDLALVWDPSYSDAARGDAEVRKLIDDRESAKHLATGLAQYQQGELIEAIAEFGQALDIAPDNQAAKESLRNASDALLNAGPAGTAARGDTARQIGRHLQAGLAFLAEKQYAKAIDEWQRILALDPRHRTANAYIAQARSLQQSAVDDLLQRAADNAAQGRWSPALRQADQALAIDPGNGAALAKKQEITAALAELAGGHARNGIALFNQGRYARAEVELKLALALDKDNRDAADCLRRIASKTLSARGQDINDLYLQGISAYTQGHYEQAIAYWQQVVKLDSTNANARRNIERAQQKLRIMGQ